MCVLLTRSRGFVLNPAARIIAPSRQKKYGPLRMPQLFRPWRVRKLSFVSWESWQTGMARIPLIERSVSVRQDVRQNVMVVDGSPDHDYEMRQLRIFQKMVERGKRDISRSPSLC